MDGFDSKQFYGHTLSLNDPKLRTTSRNYEFKYNSSEYLERVINHVRSDRNKKKPMEQNLNMRRCLYPIKVRSTSIQQSKITNIETEIGRTSSRTTVIKVMSDDEIESMLTEALVSKGINSTNTASTNFFDSKSSLESLLTNRRPTYVNKVQKRVTDSQVELLPAPVPHWVETTPVPVGTMNVSHACDSDEKTDEELILRNAEFDEMGAESPPTSHVSIGAESRLNESEREEMERVFGKQNTESVGNVNVYPSDDESYADSGGYQDEEEIEVTPEDASSSDNREFSGHAIIHIQHNLRHDEIQTCPTSESPNVSSARSHLSHESLKVSRDAKEKPVIMPMDRRIKKQIENLKHEKIRIFSKMTSIQEKIIEILDKLKLTLLELSMPDGQAEKKLRERNAFEFSVRFSRNYIFPLSRMIEDLRTSPKSDYCSAVTNEPCMKVCAIYGLLSQALQCYQKQLRHFITDSTPKKLDIVLSMISDTTKMCLDKKIFDKRDSLIHDLLRRCSIFMEFVVKLAEQKRAANEEVISVRSGRKDPLRVSKTSSKWDLTMNLNNLNMYEPKLVPKKHKKKCHKRHNTGHSSHAATSAKTTSIVTPHPTARTTKESVKSSRSAHDNKAAVTSTTDPVETQVQQMNHTESLQLLNSAIEDNLDPNLTKTVIETLQEITKDEVHSMLGPIVTNLGSILRHPVNPQTVELVLSDLNAHLLARSKQQKIDSTVTENNTQNSNTHQNEVTKKTIKASSKEERRKEKGNRMKATRSSYNINQDRTERTETRNYHMNSANSIHDKESRSNISISYSRAPVDSGAASIAAKSSTTSVKAVTKATSSLAVKHKTRSSEAFLITTPSTTTGRKPIPAPLAAVSRVKFDEATAPPTPPPTAPPPPPTPPHSSSSSPSNRMTSQYFVNTTSLSDVKDMHGGGSTMEYHGDGEHRMEYATKVEGANVFIERRVPVAAARMKIGKCKEECQRSPTRLSPPRRIRSEKSPSGQMEHLNYCSNATYTFVKYYDADAAIDNEQQEAGDEDVNEDGNDDIPEEECFTDSCTRLTPNRLSQNLSFKSLNSNSPISPRRRRQQQQQYQPEEQLQDQQLEEQYQELQEQQLEDDENKYDEDIQALLDNRSNFIQYCRDDPLYTNPQFPQPWKVLSKISQSLVQEIAGNFENELSFEEESYVRDFINMEMQT